MANGCLPWQLFLQILPIPMPGHLFLPPPQTQVNNGKKQRARAPVKQQTGTERRLVGMKQQQEANRNQACLEIGKQVNCNSFGWLGHVLVQLLGLLSLILAMPEQQEFCKLAKCFYFRGRAKTLCEIFLFKYTRFTTNHLFDIRAK